jgi:Cofactor assembly of complex C subunit B, CCB2/CCB4
MWSHMFPCTCARPLLNAHKPQCRAWEALASATSACILVVIYDGKCQMHYGLAANSAVVGTPDAGPMCQEAMTNKSGKYLAKLPLFPGRC